MKKAFVTFAILMGIFALCAQAQIPQRLQEKDLTPALLEIISASNRVDRSPSFNFTSSPYNLPDAEDILDPITGVFYEDTAWTKDFTRHIVNPESSTLTLGFLSTPEHFTVSYPDPGNPLKMQFQPIPGNWYGSELLIMVLSEGVPGTEAMAIIRLNVTSVQDPPLWSNLPDANTFNTNEETALLINFQDFVNCVDSEAENFDLFVTPAAFPIDVSQSPTAAGHLVTFSPQANYFGLATYTVTAVDRASNAFSSRDININVLNVNDAPVITSFLPLNQTLNLDQGDAQAFSAVVEDVENDLLTHTWTLSGTQNGVPFSTVLSNAASLEHTFTIPGSQNLEYAVSDGLLADTTNWTIVVRPYGPEFSPLGGLYTSTINVVLSAPDGFDGADIRYTVDGSEPNETSTLYTAPIEIAALPNLENLVTIKAVFIHPSYPTSQVESQSYTITGTVTNPVLTPLGGLFYAQTEVALSCSNPGAEIHYTTDGSEPTFASPLYTIPLTVPVETEMTIKAIALRAGWINSAVVSETYRVTGVVTITTHTMTPPPLPSGEYYIVEPGEAVSVSIASLNIVPATAILYYTLDNSLPGPGNPAAQIYTAGQLIDLTNPTWITIKAYLQDWQPSTTYSYYYDIRTRTKMLNFPNGTVFNPTPGYSTTPLLVSINTQTSPAGANIYFTTDGSDPVAEPAYLYSSPILISTTTTIKTLAQFPGLISSTIHSGEFIITGTVDAPAFNPAAGSYDAPIALTLSTVLGTTDIYYTVDGSEPSDASPTSLLYSSPIPLGLGHHLVKARAYKANWETSTISSASYDIGILPPPDFDLAGGLYFDPVTVHLSVSSVPDATIYYSIDGSEPTTASLLYNPALGIPVAAETSFTIQAIAWNDGWITSSIASRSYQVTGTVATPSFTPDGGVYPTPQNVTISSTTPSTTIRYTLDGLDPTMDYGFTYSGEINIASSTTLKARAYRDNWRPSDVYGAVFTIYGNIANPVFTPGPDTYTSPVNVYISVNPPDAEIYYTTDGSVPSSANGTLYPTGSPILVSSDTLFKAIAIKTGWNPSSVVEAQYIITGMVSAPVFAPPSGQYAVAQSVSITVNPVSATIKYTLDGTPPSLSNGFVYSGPIDVTANTIIKAYGYLNGWEDSAVATASYVINGPVGTPVINPAAGYYNSAQTVSISTYPATATIRYTTDGSEPSQSNGMVYSGAFGIDEHTVIKAFAYQSNWLDSGVATSEYFFVAGNPQFSLPAGIYADAQTLTLSVGTPLASIRYTIDGSEPSPSHGTVYGAPIAINQSGTVKAIAYRSNWISSAVIPQTYVINGPIADPLFTVPGGNYATAFNVVISTLPATATIYYTTDGTEPSNTNGTVYSTPVPINQNTVLKARAYQTNWLPSEVSSATYNLVVSQVSFDPAGGTYNAVQNVTLSTLTPSATIYYTADGSDPIAGFSPVYNPLSPIQVAQSATIKALATKNNWVSSSITSAAYVIDIPLPTAAAPQILPPSGVYNTIQTITMTSTTADASIYYTLDGSDPTPTTGSLYSVAFQLSSSATVKARTYKDGYNPSSVTSVQYLILIPIETVATPSFDPAGGIYNSSIQVTISTATPNATIRYTTDGTEPSESVGTVYSGPVNITESLTVKAMAYKTGMNNSLINNASYVINIIVPEVAAPMFSHPSGTYQQPINVSITTTTSNATIRYTMDGTLPTSTYGIIYSNPINIPGDSSLFIQAIAYRDGWITSPVVSASYTVTGTVADVSFAPNSGIYTTAQSVTLSTSTVGASIRYTTDGSQPSESSNLYSVPLSVPLNTTLTISAKAYKTGWIPSSVTQGTYIVTGTVAISQPVFSPVAGTYTSAQSVSINTPVPADAVVRYTLDGTDPTALSPQYSSPIQIALNSTVTVKAKAFRDNWIASPIYSSTYTITGQVQLPAVVFNPVGGVYQTAQSVSVNPPTLPTDATLRYTLDGSEPSLNSPAYTNPIYLALNTNTTIKVKGFKTDWLPSATATATYQITGQIVFNTPVFNPAPGVYSTAQNIAVSATVPSDATVRYSTDGSDPTETSPVYTAPIPLPLNTSLTLKVRAFKTNWTPSAIQTGAYTTTGAVSITLPVFTPAPGAYTTPQSVVLNTNTIPTGATLRYTLDGSDPSETSPVYSAPISVNTGQSVTIRVRAYLTNWLPSPIYSGAYSVTGQVSIAQPVFSPVGGVYQTAQVVTLNTTTTPTGATLRYTLDGSEPTASSPIYTSALQMALNTTTTVKVKAYLTNWTPSDTYSATYTITGTMAIQTPIFTPTEGLFQTAQSVVINSTIPAGGAVRYTTDGSTPNASSPVYSAPIAVPLNTTMTIKAMAFQTNWTSSPVYTATYTVTGQIALPATVFTPAAGTYQTAQTVTLNTNTNPTGTTLRYTLDGSEPTENSPAYTAPISLSLNSTTTISVKAYKLNWTPSITASATYVITGQVAIPTPVFTPEPGIYQTAQSVAISAPVPSDASVRYTLDGSEPTASSPAYTNPLNLALNTNTTIKAKAFKANWTSSVTYTGVYTITGQAQIAAPVFNPAPGTYPTAQNVSISSSTTPAGAQVRYTMDGSEPTASSPLYTTAIPLVLNNSYEIRARAFATNWTSSEVYVGYYTITGSIVIPDPVFTPPSGTYTTEQYIVLNTQTIPAGATLRYTLFGAEPNATSPQYTQPIQLPANANHTLKVKAFKDDWTPSPTYTAEYQITGQMALMPPYLNPAPGTYTSPISVSSVGGTNPTGGIIRYTTDGSIPTEASPEFTSPVNIGLNSIGLTITIRAFKEGWLPSLPREGIYNVTGQVQLTENMFNPAGGTYTEGQSVSLSPAVLPVDAVLRYTLDGSEPTAQSAAYTNPVQISTPNSTTTLKVKGFADGWLASETQSMVYTITGTVSPPVFSPPGGTFGAPVSVVLSSATEGAVVRYTLDGSEPTENSPAYTTPIVVANYTVDQVIKAIAFKTDWTPSASVSATYSILSSPIDVRGFTYAGYIRVLWNLPGNPRTLQGFNVYRRALSETQFTKINDALVDNVLDGNYYYDDYAITMDVSYEYYVTAVYNGNESPASTATLEYYQSQSLEISAASGAYPNPAVTGTTIKLVLNRNDNVQVAVSIYDFAGKKIQTLTVPTTDSNLIEIPWNLTNLSGNRVGRGTYFAKVVANDGVNRSERVLKIAVK